MSTYRSQTISAIVLTQNQAGTLERCLESLDWVDELLVFDRGSTDGTLEIARRFTSHVYFHPANNSATLLNDAFAAVKSDWVLVVNADEWVSEMLRHEIDGALLNPGSTNGYRIPRQLHFSGTAIAHGHTPDRELRLLRKGHGKARGAWQTEITVSDGSVGTLDRPLGWAPFSTLQDLFNHVGNQSTVDAYLTFAKKGHCAWQQSLFNLALSTKWAMFQTYVLKQGFLDGYFGAVLAMGHACRVFLQHAKMHFLLKKA